jgi:hypothetical protein
MNQHKAATIGTWYHPDAKPYLVVTMFEARELLA